MALVEVGCYNQPNEMIFIRFGEFLAIKALLDSNMLFFAA